MTHHDEKRSAQVDAGILQRAQHFVGDHVSGHANDEELTKSGVEDQFRRHTRVAAAEESRVRLLALGQVGQDVLLNGGKARLSANESLVTSLEARQYFVGRRLLLSGSRCRHDMSLA